MNNRGMEAFLAIAMGKTLSRAAELLNLTQSTVSYRLREFEEELGVILIDRQKGLKTVRLTPPGEQLLPIVVEWRKLQHEVGKISARSSAHYLRIGAVDSVNNGILPGLFKSLREHVPPVYLKISTNDSLILYDKVESHEVDAAFVLQALPNPYVQVEPFFSETMLVARFGGKNAAGETVNACDLDNRYELRIAWGPEFQLWHDRIWDPLSSTEICLDTISLIYSLLEDERQWAIVPESATYLLRPQGITFQRLNPQPPDRVCYKIKHRFPRLSAVAPLGIMESLASTLLRREKPSCRA